MAPKQDLVGTRTLILLVVLVFIRAEKINHNMHEYVINKLLQTGHVYICTCTINSSC